MQNVLGQESVTTERGGIKMVMDGNMKVTEFSAEDSVSKDALMRLTPDIVNDSIKSVQKIMAKKMQEMGGFPGLS